MMGYAESGNDGTTVGGSSDAALVGLEWSESNFALLLEIGEMLL